MDLVTPATAGTKSAYFAHMGPEEFQKAVGRFKGLSGNMAAAEPSPRACVGEAVV